MILADSVRVLLLEIRRGKDKYNLLFLFSHNGMSWNVWPCCILGNFCQICSFISYIDYGKLINFIGSYRFLYIYSNFDALLNNLLLCAACYQKIRNSSFKTSQCNVVDISVVLICYVIYLSIEHSFSCTCLSEDLYRCMFLSFCFKMKSDAMILKFPRFCCAKNSYYPSSPSTLFTDSSIQHHC
jgi:hypothetical protein